MSSRGRSGDSWEEYLREKLVESMMRVNKQRACHAVQTI